MTLIECTNTREIPDLAQGYQLGENETAEDAVKKYAARHKVEFTAYHWGHWVYFLESGER